MSDIAGVLLAGGRGRRMGGADKALLPLAGRPLIAHAAGRLAPQVAALIVNANGDPARFAFLGLPVVADESADFPGPLAGLLAALDWLARRHPACRTLASVSADAPFIPADLVARLGAAHAAAPERPAVAQSHGRRHHVIGLWPLAAAGEIRAALARGERKAEALVDRLGAVTVPFPDIDIAGRSVDPFFNVNTPDDLAFAEGILADAAASAPTCAEGDRARPFVVGIVGWKDAGKTTLAERLVAALVARGLTVSTVKHSHHDIAFEPEEADSARHRRAGAREVAIATPRRWALIAENRDAMPPSLDDIVARLAPADIVLVEGWKGAAIPKIEARRKAGTPGSPLADSDPLVFAIAADHAVADAPVPVFALDDVDGLAGALLAERARSAASA